MTRYKCINDNCDTENFFASSVASKTKCPSCGKKVLTNRVSYDELLGVLNDLIHNNYGVQWTVRQMYYRIISPPYQIYENKRSSYTSFDDALTRMRERGDISDHHFVDTARRTEGGDFSDWEVQEFFVSELKSIRDKSSGFSRSFWDRQDYNIVVVLEKDALARLISPVTREYRVCLAVGRGYSSRTQILQIAGELDSSKTNVVLYIGDFDPTGLDIERSLEKRLYEESGVDFELKRVAITFEQAEQYPPNYTKVTDSRNYDYIEKYGDQCWEADAIPTPELQRLLREAIVEYIDMEQWDEDNREEEEGIELLNEMFKGVNNFLKEHYDLEYDE